MHWTKPRVQSCSTWLKTSWVDKGGCRVACTTRKSIIFSFVSVLFWVYPYIDFYSHAIQQYTLLCWSVGLFFFKSRAMRLYTMLCQSVPRSVPRSVCPLVRWSVGPSHFTFLGFLRFFTSLLLPKWSSEVNYHPWPPARNWGSRVSVLVWISWGFVLLSITLVRQLVCQFVKSVKV